MKITWMGHACFAMETADGTRIVTDPFDESVGYPLPWGPADIVTVSHEHHDHNCAERLNPRRVVRGAGTVDIGAVHITGIPAFHDEAQGKKRGANTIFVIEADGLRMAHLGDLGHPLSAETRAAIGKIDVLMLPVGGFYTIDGAQAAQEVRALQPRVALPMHYKTAYLDYPITDEQPFLAVLGQEAREMSCLNVGEDVGPVVLLALAREE